jgi:hypothetical protein
VISGGSSSLVRIARWLAVWYHSLRLSQGLAFFQF